MSTQVTIGPLSLNSYTAWIGLCAMLGVAWSVWQSGPSWRDRLRVLDGWLLIGACALFVGRAGYLVLNAAYFAERPSEITFAPAPGISEHAAVLGGWIGWWLAGRLTGHLKRPQPVHLAVLASLVGIGASIGCVSNVCAFGREVFWTDGLAWQMRVDWPDAYWISNPRLPTQVFMAVWLLICAGALVLRSRHRAQDATLLVGWLLLFSAGDFAIQFGRADATQEILGLRIQQGLDVSLFILSLVLLVARRVRSRAAHSVGER